MNSSTAGARRRRWWRVWLLGLCGVATVVALSGCESVSFYRQAVAGEYQILAHQKPLATLIADPHTAPSLRQKFEDVLKIRDFAATEMKEPADESYLKYVDLHRPFVVWNVNVAPALSLAPKTWWFPIVGRASYRGYFSQKAARRYAERWKKKGYDVYVAGVQVYSTLGWFHDPVLSTFINEPEGDLAQIIFHELGHQRLFVEGDTDFNEAFATTVAMEGIRRWFAAHHQPQEFERYHREAIHEDQFIKLVLSIRPELQAVYSDPKLSTEAKLQRKQELIEDLRRRYETLKNREWGGSKEYDGWFAGPINNAKLNTIAAYYDLAPAFETILKNSGGDMEKFFQECTVLAKMPLEERHAALQKLLPQK